MARISDADPDRLEPAVKAVLDAQAKQWGAPLLNHRVYARRPTIFRGARAMWSGLDASGLLDKRLVALLNRRVASLNSEAERVALEYADAMTITGRDTSEELFERVRRHYAEDALVELTAVIAWENSSSKFNRAMRVPSQKLWRPRGA